MKTTNPKTTTSAPALSEAVSRILLGGWSSGWGRIDRLDPADARAIASLYNGNAAYWSAAWTEHEDTLRATAAALGIKPGVDGQYFAERIAARLATRSR